MTNGSVIADAPSMPPPGAAPALAWQVQGGGGTIQKNAAAQYKTETHRMRPGLELVQTGWIVVRARLRLAFADLPR